MRSRRSPLACCLLLAASTAAGQAEPPIRAAGQPAQLDIRQAGPRSVRVTLKPVTFTAEFPENPAVAVRPYGRPAISLRTLAAPVVKTIGSLAVTVRPDPLTVIVRDANARLVQVLVFESDGTLSFSLDGQPVLGMGEGGRRPEPGTPWRAQPVQFDRRGHLDTMEPRWQSDMYGSRNPAAMLLGTGGWGVFVATPWVQVDLRNAARGVFIPFKPSAGTEVPQTQRNQQLSQNKGIHPVSNIVPGAYDLFVFDASDPAMALRDFSAITGPAAMPPKLALGYMQSHRTLEDDAQMLNIVDTFRAKQIPLDAVIYLGTGFCPRGWNRPQPSFEFNPEVFTRDPKAVLADLRNRHARVVVHMVPGDRDKLPTLHGSIPGRPGEVPDASHIQTYWRPHAELMLAGVDAFWPDEGDWFNLFERIKRHELYYSGALSTRPNVRPWSLQRNGFPGIARWGGWVWSGDTESAWKTLEAQVAVGLNYSLSIGPFWGSDIGGFYPTRELTGELYARWHQFAAFCGSFRSHGRTWWLRLPWGWGGSDMGPREYGNANNPIPPDDPPAVLQSEMNNPAIEPVVKRYSELRYRLMPYTYTLAWEARETGLPLMRAMWLHYPRDPALRALGTQYLWGRDLLVAPVFEKGATSWPVYLPAGRWYDWWDNSAHDGGRRVTRPVDLATMPIYVRAGAIVPVDPVRQYVDQRVTEPTTLRVYRGANGQFTLYEDDGISLDYLRGTGTQTRLTWDDQRRTLRIEPVAGSASGAGPRAFTVELVPDGTTKAVTFRGQAVQVRF